MNNLEYILNRSQVHKISELSLDSRGVLVPAELTQELDILNRQSETAFGAADQVNIANKILRLAAKIIALENNEIVL